MINNATQEAAPTIEQATTMSKIAERLVECAETLYPQLMNAVQRPGSITSINQLKVDETTRTTIITTDKDTGNGCERVQIIVEENPIDLGEGIGIGVTRSGPGTGVNSWGFNVTAESHPTTSLYLNGQEVSPLAQEGRRVAQSSRDLADALQAEVELVNKLSRGAL